MDFRISEDESSRRNNDRFEQFEKANEWGMSKNVADGGTLFSHGDTIGDMLENFSHLKIHNIPECPDKVPFTHSPLHEFSSHPFPANRQGHEQSTFPFEISPNHDFHTRNVEEFNDYSTNRGLRPRSFSDRGFSFSRRGNGRDFTEFDYEEMRENRNIFNERSPPISPRQHQFQEQRRPAFPKTTKNRNEGRGERTTYQKDSLHKTMSLSGSPKRNHMPVTRSKSLGGKPNDPFRNSYGGGSMGGWGMPSLRRRALTNATSLSVPYQESSHEMKQEYRHGMRNPRKDNKSHHPKLGRYGTHNKKPQRLDFIGLLPVQDVPGIDTGEVTFCPSSGCKHTRNSDWGAQNGEPTSLEFIYFNPHANKSSTISLSEHPEDEADDDEFFQKFSGLESKWNRRHSSPLSSSQWSPTSPQPSIWQPSNEVNLSPFAIHLSNSGSPTPCSTPVSLKVPSPSDLAKRGTTSPANYGGDMGFFQEGTFRKQEEIQRHHPALRRYMSDPPGCSTWHPLRSSLRSPLNQDREGGKHYSYEGK